MRLPLSPAAIFKERRQLVIDSLKENEAVVLPSQPVVYRQPDVPHPFRQNSFFYYLTGFEDSDAFLVLKKTSPSHLLFVQEKNKEKEQWDGFRFGPDEAKDVFLMDQCEKSQLWREKLGHYLHGVSSIYSIRSIHPEWDRHLEQWISIQKTKGCQYSLLEIKDKLSSMRQIKTPHEVQKMKKACAVSRQAHIDVMKACRPGVNERALHGVFIESIMNQNCERESYPGIFASGSNALILHYIQNNKTCEEGELVLVDAGAEWEYYASDITRTFPVTGRYSPAQKILYSHVLDTQKKIIRALKPGVSPKRIQKQTQEMLFECLRKENILQKTNSAADVKKFFPHNFGHFLGLDVHDVSFFEKEDRLNLLKAGMAVTVEPGLYIPLDDKTVPEEFRGIGIRIEDDILITEEGCENLSEDIPKEAEEIEQIMAS